MNIEKLIDQIEEKESISNDVFKKWLKEFGLTNVKYHLLVDYVESLHSKIAGLEADKLRMKIDADIEDSIDKLKRKNG